MEYRRDDDITICHRYFGFICFSVGLYVYDNDKKKSIKIIEMCFLFYIITKQFSVHFYSSYIVQKPISWSTQNPPPNCNCNTIKNPIIQSVERFRSKRRRKTFFMCLLQTFFMTIHKFFVQLKNGATKHRSKFG